MLEPDQRAARDAAIQAFVEKFAPGRNADLYANMITTITRLAHEDCDRGDVKILDSALKELRYAFKTFAPYSHIRKVTIFGSARTRDGHPEYVQAARFAECMRKANWMIITGAGDGIMKAGHGGAGADASFGVAIRLPFEQKTNAIIENDHKLVQFKYFFTRKLMFIKEASAVALFPGGFGTQDEGFEALTLVQTGKAAMMPIVLIDAPGGTYWQHWRTYVAAELLRTGMISEEDMHLFLVTDSAEAAANEIVRFWRSYHSSRYVGPRLIMRFNHRIPDAQVAALNEEFHDILAEGDIEATPPDPMEGDEHLDKFRLGLFFNRRSLGRLRVMIDRINALNLTEPPVAGT